MNDSPGTIDAFSRVHDFLVGRDEGSLGVEQVAAFERQLQQDAELLQTYVMYIRDTFDLPRRLVALDAAGPAGARAATEELVELPPASRRRVRDLWEFGWEIIKQPLSLAMIVSTLVITTILLSLELWTLPNQQPVAAGARTTFVARISETSQAAFDPDSDGNLKNRDLFADDRIVLESGLVRINYDNGAQIVLHGPATYHVQGSNGGELHLGKLVATADTEESQGFAVAIPGARIVDLGTEFGVEVPVIGAAEVAVFHGKVELTATGSRSGSPQAIRLTANQAAIIDAQGGKITRSPQTTSSLAAIRKPWNELVRQARNEKPTPIFAEGFEDPVQPANAWQQANGIGKGDLTGFQWEATGGAGLSRNFSGFQFRQSAAPEGEQLALIQNEGSFKRTIAGFVAGRHYRLSLRAMARQGFDGGNDLEVVLDAGQPTEVVLIDMGEVSFDRFTKLETPSFAAIKESYELTIRGSNDGGRLEGDRTTLLDEVTIWKEEKAVPSVQESE